MFLRVGIPMDELLLLLERLDLEITEDRFLT